MFFQNNKNLNPAKNTTKCISTKDANRFSVSKFSFVKPVVICVTLFLFNISPINAQIESEIYGEKINTDPTYTSSLMLAVSSDDIDGVKFFSRAGGFIINQKNIGGATALHVASRNGNLEIVNILLENGADPNISDNEGWTPLMRACTSKNYKVVEALLNKNADASLLNLNNESALIQAALANCTDCIDQIFTKSNLIKSTNTKILKEQLVDVFVIARNHENQKMQNLIEGYLDRINKMMPLTPALESTNKTIFFAPNNSNNSENKTKYVLNKNETEGNESNLEKNSENDIASILLPQQKTENLSKNSKAISDEKIETNKPSQTNNLDSQQLKIVSDLKSQENLRQKKLFKLISGEPKAEFIENNSVSKNISSTAVKDNKKSKIKYKIITDSKKSEPNTKNNKGNYVDNKKSGYHFIAGEKKKRAIRKKILETQKATSNNSEKKLDVALPNNATEAKTSTANLNINTASTASHNTTEESVKSNTNAAKSGKTIEKTLDSNNKHISKKEKIEKSVILEIEPQVVQ